VRKRDQATDIAPRHAIFGRQLIKALARRLAFLIVASKHKLGKLANLFAPVALFFLIGFLAGHDILARRPTHQHTKAISMG
jgi:hypothetical protein